MENETHTIEPVVESQTKPQLTDREMLEEIYKNSKSTKNYMKWQLIITVAFVVIPLVATLVLIPYTIKSLTSSYGLDSLTGGNPSNINASSLQDLIKQYTK